MQRRHAPRYTAEHAFFAHQVSWAIFTYFFSSSPCRSTSGECYRRPPIRYCRSRRFLPAIQVRRYCIDTSHLLSCHSNLPWCNLLRLLFGGDWSPFTAFSISFDVFRNFCRFRLCGLPLYQFGRGKSSTKVRCRPPDSPGLNNPSVRNLYSKSEGAACDNHLGPGRNKMPYHLC